jgi:hypothetical protein
MRENQGERVHKARDGPRDATNGVGCIVGSLSFWIMCLLYCSFPSYDISWKNDAPKNPDQFNVRKVPETKKNKKNMGFLYFSIKTQ